MTSFDIADTVLPEIWASHARNRPASPALVCAGEVVSWGDFNARMNRLANALLASGVGKGDRVAVLASSSVAACVAMFGTVKSGAAMVPISSMLAADQVATILNDCGASHVLCTADLRHLVDAVRPQLTAVVSGGFVGLDFAEPEGAHGGWRDFAEFSAGVDEAEPPVVLGAHDVFSIMYSSGTTGAPKGVVHLHGARTYFALSNGFEMGYAPGARGLVTTALYTAGTWLVVMPTLLVGGTLHIHARYDAQRYVDALEAEGITHTFAVPSQLRALLDEGRLDGRAFPDLRVLLSAGSPLRPEEKKRLIGLIGRRFYELYGFTEGGSTLLRPEDQAAKPTSVGKPLMGQELVILDEGRICGPGEPGEIATRGPGLLREYAGREDATRAAIWRDAGGRSFVRSGDVGQLDEEGFLYILDRKKDMIISGGLNIYPADLEGVLCSHPAVADVCVIGIAHPKWDETPLGLVVLHPGAAIEAEELRIWANARLGKHQRLSHLLLRTDLPRNALGKVLKRELRIEYTQWREAAVPGATS
ncbi:class I adenylate-forming enzyme family protein [Novosphingobium decolorationis]|uniref:AMP-binding protein n=1 Tax=Novosphingobium decolorationis TaxID=2698673 RepID=A0ABX8E104_9SPHN|nr:AMP-binding protein [Novosphingobium decolorationis]MED5546692.1 AMP-binding protein [Pseudomonadota bacterium]MEE3155020.1 AMP-binding protein [Pseudomonadota bacterium]QVM82613.1 AMP-binding protein [Novosphingobium decolorationis]